MLRSSIRQRFVLLEIVAACALLAACGGGGEGGAAGNSTALVAATAPAATAVADASVVGTATNPDGAVSAADTAEAADGPVGVSDGIGSAAAPAAAPGEPAWGSMEAVSESYGDSLAEGEPVLTEQATPEALEEAATATLGIEPATDPAANAATRETAQSLSIDSGDGGYAKPKVAALDYSSDSGSTRASQLAKYKFVILGGRMGSTLASLASNIRSRNSSTQIAAYVAFNELDCSLSSSHPRYALVQAANKAKWWLRKANGTRSQWSTLYNHCDMNISRWATRDSSGRTWQQYRANWDYSDIFSRTGSIGWVFSDNTFHKPRVDADWRRIGTNQLRTDPTILSAQRAGQVAYWNALHNRKSSLKVLGNVDGDLSPSEYVERLPGAFMEGAIGRSYSLETWAGWDRMMARYRALLRNTVSPNAVFLQTYGGSTDFRQMRFGLASAMLENGYYVYLPSSGTLKSASYDEYQAPIGRAIESPPTGPKQNGIWARRYENGIVLVNPSKTYTRSIYVGTSYKRLKGTQNPSVNNGYAQSTVTLAPRSGLIMIRR